MKLSYNLARRLKRYKEDKRNIEALEAEMRSFVEKNEEEKKEEIERIEELASKKFKANSELSSTSVIDKDQRNQIQRRYREKQKLKAIEKARKEGKELSRKPIAARTPIRVFAIRIKELEASDLSIIKTGKQNF